MRLSIATIGALLPLLTGSAAAQNLVVSPDFDAAAEVLDWPDPFPDANTSISWQSDVDRDGSPTSGSLRIDSAVSNGASDGSRQCVDVGTGDYHAEVWVRVPTQTNPRTGSLSIEYYPSAGCLGPQFPFDFQSAPGVPDTWERIELDVTAPSGTASIGVRLLAGQNFDPTPSFLFFDQVRLEATGPDPQPFTGTLTFPAASPFLAVPGASFAGSGTGVSRQLPINEVRSFTGVSGFTGASTTMHGPGITSSVVASGLGDPSFTGTAGGGGLHGALAVQGFLRREYVPPATSASFSWPLTSMGTAGLGLGGTRSGPGGETVSFGTWNTGPVVLAGVITQATSMGATSTGTLSASGFDARTPSGAGTVQLVTAMRVTGGPAADQALIAEITLEFAPEPGRASLLIAGSLAVAWLGCRRREGRRRGTGA